MYEIRAGDNALVANEVLITPTTSDGHKCKMFVEATGLYLFYDKGW